MHILKKSWCNILIKWHYHNTNDQNIQSLGITMMSFIFIIFSDPRSKVIAFITLALPHKTVHLLIYPHDLMPTSLGPFHWALELMLLLYQQTSIYHYFPSPKSLFKNFPSSSFSVPTWLPMWTLLPLQPPSYWLCDFPNSSLTLWS